MLFTYVGVGNCSSLRNANAVGSCQALIRGRGVHRSDHVLETPPPRRAHMHPRLALPADGCGRPQGALFSSTLSVLVFQLLFFFSFFLLQV